MEDIETKKSQKSPWNVLGFIQLEGIKQSIKSDQNLVGDNGLSTGPKYFGNFSLSCLVGCHLGSNYCSSKEVFSDLYWPPMSERHGKYKLGCLEKIISVLLFPLPRIAFKMFSLSYGVILFIKKTFSTALTFNRCENVLILHMLFYYTYQMLWLVQNCSSR